MSTDDDLIRRYDDMTIEERCEWMDDDPDRYWAAAEASAGAMVERDAARLRLRDAQRRRERLARPFRRILTAARKFGGDQ